MQIQSPLKAWKLVWFFLCCLLMTESLQVWFYIQKLIVCLNRGTGKSTSSQAIKQEIYLVKSKALGKNNSVHQYLVLTRNCFTKIAVWECKMHYLGHEFDLFNKISSCKHSTPLYTCKILKTTYPMQKGVFYSLFPPNKLAIIIYISSISSIFTKNLIPFLTFNYFSPITFTNKTLCQ